MLAAGEQGRYAVLHGGKVHSIWDTSRDASQRGHEMFDDGRFLAQSIDAMLLPVLDTLFGPVPNEGG